MKIENSIGWCDETTNAVTGCDKVSDGCKNCFAQVGTRARVLRAMGIETWGPKGMRHPVTQFAQKLRALNKKCVCDRCREAYPVQKLEGTAREDSRPTCTYCGGALRRIRLFADSNSDWLDKKWPVETLAHFLKEIHDAPNVDVLLLTKRPENFVERLHLAMRVIQDGTDDWISGWLDGKAPANIWIGTSVENQSMADLRIPRLLQIPAKVRFLSCEPLLEPINIENFVLPMVEDIQKIYAGMDPDYDENKRWIIVGGESGKNRRDCGVEAIVSVAEQCIAAHIPVYVKQDCAFKSGEQGRIPEGIWRLKQFPRV